MPIPLITVIIDTYNHESFIADAIQSVLAQDFPPLETEVLVVDDGSTDDTPEIVRKFAPRLRLLRKPNGGQASAFNAAIPEARGRIVAFLDGDDWWAPGKLAAVTEALAANPDVGLVGHGITEVYPDGRRIVQVPRKRSHFRITSPEQARLFRMCRGFLGTSRMAYRKEILRRIGPVPESLKFEADEYLFTLAGLFADVTVLPGPLTFYRLHDANLFQFSHGGATAIRRKQQVLASLAHSLDTRLKQENVPADVARTILECVEVEANLLRLVADSGFPWETVATELKIMRIFHSDASPWQHLFSYARLVPAFFLPAAAYYRWRHRFSSLPLYQRLRRKALPFPVPAHIDRHEKPERLSP
jgi:glycosyltransferase involved in cell wall biosynthesis